jgi:hypothetical protein
MIDGHQQCKLTQCDNTSSIEKYIGDFAINGRFGFENGKFIYQNPAGDDSQSSCVGDDCGGDGYRPQFPPPGINPQEQTRVYLNRQTFIECPSGELFLKDGYVLPPFVHKVDNRLVFSAGVITSNMPEESAALILIRNGVAVTEDSIRDIEEQYATYQAREYLISIFENGNASCQSPKPRIYRNSPQRATCDSGDSINVIDALPNWISVDGNSLVVASGLFASKISQAAADAAALKYIQDRFLTYFVQGSILCGWWNDEVVFPCPPCTGLSPDSVTIPAFTYFSDLSKAIAQADAEAAALGACGAVQPPPDFSTLIWDNIYQFAFSDPSGHAATVVRTPASAETGASFTTTITIPAGSYTLNQYVDLTPGFLTRLPMAGFPTNLAGCGPFNLHIDAIVFPDGYDLQLYDGLVKFDDNAGGSASFTFTKGGGDFPWTIKPTNAYFPVTFSAGLSFRIFKGNYITIPSDIVITVTGSFTNT